MPLCDPGASPPTASATPAPALTDLLATHGFAPDVTVRADGAVSCRLGNCPYRASARANPDIVCGLHRGLTRGLLDGLAPTAVLTRFVPHDPDRAGCEIEIEGLA